MLLGTRTRIALSSAGKLEIASSWVAAIHENEWRRATRLSGGVDRDSVAGGSENKWRRPVRMSGGNDENTQKTALSTVFVGAHHRYSPPPSIVVYHYSLVWG
jgi:hypothetical protein